MNTTKTFEMAQETARRLFAFERAIDKAIAHGAELAAYLPLARIDANLAAEVGHEGLAAAIASVGELAKARSKVVEAHQHFRVTSDELNVTVAVGGGGGKPTLPLVAEPALRAA
jgi:hypothetical protein